MHHFDVDYSISAANEGTKKKVKCNSCRKFDEEQLGQFSEKLIPS